MMDLPDHDQRRYPLSADRYIEATLPEILKLRSRKSDRESIDSDISAALEASGLKKKKS
jgi:hypothetical protein